MPDPAAPQSFRDPIAPEETIASFTDGAVVQLLMGAPDGPEAAAVELVPATVVVTSQRVIAVEADDEWSWQLEDLERVHHSPKETWTILPVPGVEDFGVSVATEDVARFRAALDRVLSGDPHGDHEPAVDLTDDDRRAPGQESPVERGRTDPEPSRAATFVTMADLTDTDPRPEVDPQGGAESASPEIGGQAAGGPEPEGPTGVVALGALAFHEAEERATAASAGTADGTSRPASEAALDAPVDEPLTRVDLPAVRPDEAAGAVVAGGSAVSGRRGLRARLGRQRRNADGSIRHAVEALPLVGLEAKEISAWFGTHHVLDRISLDMPAGRVTALIGPSGCGKSTFIRILNRMHEMIPSASLSGEVLLDGEDIYDPQRKLTEARRQIGMVFQKPNPFPAMSIYDNVVASFQLTGLKVGQDEKDETVETCLRKAGLWNEVRDRLRQPGGGLSGGQQQRLCIARALAIKPRVLLMDEPCSALDPTSTRRIEQTIVELASEVTIVIVTHNMQQAARVSDQCAFFLAEQGTPGVIVEHGPTEAMFQSPQDPRTHDYVNGRFG